MRRAATRGIRSDWVDAARDTLGSAPAVAERLPGDVRAELVHAAREAFASSFRVASVIALAIVMGMSILTVVFLKRAPPSPAAEPS